MKDRNKQSNLPAQLKKALPSDVSPPIMLYQDPTGFQVDSCHILQVDHYFEMLYKCKSNHTLLKGKDTSLLKGKDLSLLQLTTLSNFLEGQQGLAQNITKEIKNQIHLSKKNQRIIDKSMNRINERAEQLVRRFEQEKEKHEKLTFLVNHIENEIYNAKLDKSLELKGKAETDRLQELTALQKTRERELQKVCEKTNNSSYELSKKLDAIRALRSERTIVSELLDKIQRELCNLEHCYKVLVIERTIEEHQCQEKLEDFRKVQQSARKEIQRALSLRKEAKEQREEETKLIVHHTLQAFPKEPTTYLRPSYTENSIQAGSQASLRQVTQTQSDLSMGKEKDRHKEKRAKIENDIQKLQREKTVKIVLNELGISSPKELPQGIDDLLRDNGKTLSELERLEQDIEEMEASMWRLAQRKNRRKKNSEKKQVRRDVKEQLRDISDQIRQSKLQSAQFKEIAKILYCSITELLPQPPEPVQFYNQEQQVRFYMGFLESFFEKSYVEPPSRACPKDGNTSKRLTSLLSNPLLERNQMSIYEEQDLLQFAKKNLERTEKGFSGRNE